jgi:hypothetical protein
MRRSRKFKDELDRPPHRPLTKEEVERIARAGGIGFAGRLEEAQEFEAALEMVRCEYKSNADWKKLSLTDRQLCERLHEVRNLARRLQRLLIDPPFDYQTCLLIEGDDEPCPGPTSELEPLRTIILRAELGLRKLKERSVKSPNDWAISSASKPGLIDLVRSLVYVWQVATNTIKPQTGKNSLLIPFLREGAYLIAQHGVDTATATKWARSLVSQASKDIELGYLLLRKVDDPDVVRYLANKKFRFNRLI